MSGEEVEATFAFLTPYESSSVQESQVAVTWARFAGAALGCTFPQLFSPTAPCFHKSWDCCQG